MTRSLMLSLILLAAPAAFAADMQLTLTKGDFKAQRAQIERDLADGETYAEISRNDRTQVRESLDRISNRLANVSSVEELPEPLKVALFNDQEMVNTILTQAGADSRLVCDRSRPTGTRFQKTTCQTVAERRRRQDADQEHLRKIQNGIGPPNN